MASNAIRPVRPCRTHASFALNPSDRRGESRNQSRRRRDAGPCITSLSLRGLLGSLLLLLCRLLLGGFTFLGHKIVTSFLDKILHAPCTLCQRNFLRCGDKNHFRATIGAFCAAGFRVISASYDAQRCASCVSWRKVRAVSACRRSLRRRFAVSSRRMESKVGRLSSSSLSL